MDPPEVAPLKQRAVQSDLAVKALIQELYKCCESWETFHHLHREVAKNINCQKNAISELETLTQVMRKSAEQDVLLTELEGFRAQLESNYLSLKRGSAFSRQAIESQVQSELFAGKKDAEDEGTRKRRLDKDSLSKKASNLTEDLLSISQLMSDQVAVSEQSLNSLITSSAVVTETQEEFKSMGSLLGQSRKLLSKYGRREITDRVLIFLALAFFFACCLYVVLKRLF